MLSKLHNGKIPTESWLSPQYDGETRLIGIWVPHLKTFLLQVPRHRLRANKRTIQPNNKAPRRTLTLTILYEKRLNWNKLETFSKRPCGCFSQFLRRSNRRFCSTEAWITRNKRSLISGLVHVRLWERRIHAKTECNLGTSYMYRH